MRAQPFLGFLQHNYDPDRAADLANNHRIQGGWEVWLQVEIALTFQLQHYAHWLCVREAPYPSGLAAPNVWIADNPPPHPNYVASAIQGLRCDFYLRRQDAIQDETYIELKCINPNVMNPLDDAWDRFRTDIYKIRRIAAVNHYLNGIALLATFGTFVGPLPQLPGGQQAYVWDPYGPLGNQANFVTLLAGVAQGGIDRFFIVAASVG